MADTHATKPEISTGMTPRDAAQRLDAVGWGLFFLWVGSAWLAGIDEGVGLLGVGIITLGVQVLRRYAGLALEGFWVVVGSLFALGGLWQVLDAQLPLVPFLLVLDRKSVV